MNRLRAYIENNLKFISVEAMTPGSDVAAGDLYHRSADFQVCCVAGFKTR